MRHTGRGPTHYRVADAERYFTTAPVNAPVDDTAVCVDSDQPNITEDDYVTYWQTVFDD